MLVVKRFSFEAAHMLPYHDGKCRDLHGHSYVVEVGVEGPLSSGGGLSRAPDEGMVIDFARISAVFKERVHSVCDHKYLNDVLPIPVTTAERIADWILAEMRYGLEHPTARVTFVRVFETATSYAEAR